MPSGSDSSTHGFDPRFCSMGVVSMGMLDGKYDVEDRSLLRSSLIFD